MADTDTTRAQALRLADSLRKYASVGSSLALPKPKRTALDAADALAALASVPDAARQAEALEEIRGHLSVGSQLWEIADAALAAAPDEQAEATCTCPPDAYSGHLHGCPAGSAAAETETT